VLFDVVPLPASMMIDSFTIFESMTTPQERMVVGPVYVVRVTGLRESPGRPCG
jgi:hypothetical protein